MGERSKRSLAVSGQRLELLASLLAEEGIGQDTPESIPRRENPQELPLSFGQRRLWLLDRLENGIHYNDHFDLRLSGPLNAPVLGRTIEEIVKRHEAMRSVIAEVDGGPLQTITPAQPVALPRIDLTDLPEAGRMIEATRLAVEEARKPFNLSQGPLWRFTLVAVAEDDHILLITAHHIAIDGWSRGVFLHELSVLYTAFMAGGPSPLKELPIQFADYAAWQAQWVESDAVAGQLDYWKRELAGASAFLALPTDRPRPPLQSFCGARHWLTLSPAATASLKDLCQRERVSLFMALLAVLQVLLSRYTGQEDILVWTPVANRMRKEQEEMIGYFLNMLVLRGRLSGNPPFRELLRRARETTLGALAHQDLPLEKLVDVLQPERNQGYPLFQVLFVLQNVPMPNVEMSGLNVREFEVDSGTANFDLTISLTESADGLRGRIEYATDLFDAERIERMAGHFQTVIEQICENPGERLSQLCLLTAGERNQLLIEWNRAEADDRSHACIHELFEVQAQRAPERIALEFQTEEWSYGRLQARSSRIANHLQSLGVGPGVLVGLYMEPSPQRVASVLGILKAGGAYLPLDPSEPNERLAFVLKDAQAKAVITETPLLEKVRGLVDKFDGASFPGIVCVGEISDIDPGDQNGARHAAGPEDLACVIYTSGSTGKPNGVQIEHRSVVNVVESMRREPNLGEEDILVTTGLLSQDNSILELFLPLTTGGRIVISNPQTASDADRLARLLERSAATVMQASPSTWRRLIQAGWKGHAKFKILCGGEAWDPDLAAQLLARCGSLWNFYGTTETTVWSAVSRVADGGAVLVAGPIANTRFYIVDKFLQPVPIGVPGELCIGGDGVARGYLDRPELTSEKFIADSFFAGSGSRLYRTGDLARYRGKGAIEFLGRLDHQVNVRGFRIELGEIEWVMGQHPQIKKAVVSVREDVPGDSRLVAHVVPATAAAAPGAGELRAWLCSKLPEYMVPAVFVTMETLPLAPNGTVNRKALPEPSNRTVETSPRIAAPRDVLEQQLVKIWENVLGVRLVGLRDNFFDLGGRSLTAVRLFAEVRKQTGRTVPLATLFQAPTVEQLAEFLRKDGWSSHWSSLVPIQPGGSKTPLFCVHGGGGNVLLFRDLARRLGSDYPFYALQSQGLDGKGNYLTTVADMASHYLKEIRQLQPSGPYYFGGYCMGGSVAYEIAQQLREQNQEVRLLVMFDTYNHNGTAPQMSFRDRVRSFSQKIQFHWANVARLSPKERIGYLGEKLRRAREREFGNLSVKLASLAKSSGTRMAKSNAGIKLEYVNDQAGFAYRPKPYAGKISLFLPRRNYYFLGKPSMGWTDFAAGGVTIFEIPVDPGGMFVEPYVQTLADKLRSCIDEAEKALVAPR